MSYLVIVVGSEEAKMLTVVSEELPQVYILEGHGEADLPASLQEQIEKENMETNTWSERLSYFPSRFSITSSS